MNVDLHQLALQVPGMAVLAVIVWFFLKHLGKHTDDFRTTIQDQTKLTSTCVDRMVKTHERTVESLDRNTEMFGKVELRLDQLTDIENQRLKQHRGE